MCINHYGMSFWKILKICTQRVCHVTSFKGGSILMADGVQRSHPTNLLERHQSSLRVVRCGCATSGISHFGLFSDSLVR